jgi:hypothetical protein
VVWYYKVCDTGRRDDNSNTGRKVKPHTDDFVA